VSGREEERRGEESKRREERLMGSGTSKSSKQIKLRNPRK
jgi:hypothetical protein